MDCCCCFKAAERSLEDPQGCCCCCLPQKVTWRRWQMRIVFHPRKLYNISLPPKKTGSRNIIDSNFPETAGDMGQFQRSSKKGIYPPYHRRGFPRFPFSGGNDVSFTECKDFCFGSNALTVFRNSTPMIS